MSDRNPEFDIRKGIHIKLLPDTKNAFRVLTFKKGLSMQEVMEEFAQRCVNDDPKCLKVLDELIQKKKEKIKSQLSSTDAESLFDIIELDNPFDEQ